MQAIRLDILEFLRRSRGQLVLDVRSPSEYAHAHLPGALSLPLFTDEERKVVGTAYKQESREQAIKHGLDFFGPKMRAMIEEVEKALQQRGEGSEIHSMPVFVYCWRGGMRSGAVSWLLSLYGFRVFVLEGGYKAFRNWTLGSLALPFNLILLGGYTGSGKTKVLEALAERGEPMIDLEAIACHKGSAFGKTGQPQPSPEMFENEIALQLHQQAGTGYSLDTPLPAHPPIWAEDESQRIGTVNIPLPLWKQMRISPLVFLDIPFEERLDYIVTEYGQIPVDKLIEGTERISKRFGPMETRNTIAFLQEGNLKEAFRLLLHYYDKGYKKGLHNRENLSALLHTVCCAKVDPQNAALLHTQNQTL